MIRPRQMATSFDLFGTLVETERPERPADAVGAELVSRGVTLPAEWVDSYRTPQFEIARGREVSLPAHVAAVFDNAATETPDRALIHEAVLAAFDQPVHTREGATAAIRAVAEHGPVGLLSNCSVPGLVERTLERSEIDPGQFGAVVTSVGCGWRKPDSRAFEQIAAELDVSLPDLLHVGDDPETDGGADDVGTRVLLLNDVALTELPERIAAQTEN